MKIFDTIRNIYTPLYIAVNVVIAVVYFYLIKYILTIQQQGIPITTVPLFLIYILVITSSITLTIAIYSINNTHKNRAKFSASSISAATTLVGGVVTGCGCQAAILFNVLAIGLGSGEATLINTVATENAALIFGALIIINLVVIGYYFNKLSKSACKIKR